MKLNISSISLIILLVSILASIIIFTGCSAFGTKPNQKDVQKFKSSPQFNFTKEIFENRNKEAIKKLDSRDKFEGGFLKFLTGDDKNEWPPEPGLPVLKPDMTNFLGDSDKIKVIWFGHSTFLLNFHGKIILVDPVFSESASPVPFTIKRFQKTPLTLDELPPIDYIVISHDHYDHLDIESIKFFRDHKKIKFLTPLGVGSHLRGWGIDDKQIHELDWWGALNFEGVEFIATPAQHFSGRGLSDKNKTLWASWIIKNEKSRLYFSGDSGYDTHFKTIGDKYGPFDIAFIENGQYNKSWEEVHLMPEQSVAAFYDLKAKKYFPVHWGTFKLSIHSWFEPIEKIHSSSVEKGFTLIAPRIGEIVTVSEDYSLSTWWKNFMP